MPSVVSTHRSSVISTVSIEVVHERFRLDRKIGSGGYGVIYIAKDTSTSPEEEVAVKLERNLTGHPYLLDEIRFLNLLRGGEGIPRIRWSGREKSYMVMVMDLLGPSLSDVFKLCSKQFTLHTVLMLADQMITRLEYIHSKHILHRDLKPDNFLMGKEDDASKVFIIDFGLGNKFIVPESGRHIPFRRGRSFVGTLRYASINAHLGSEMSRRDDMESLGYLLIYFMKGGRLPWQGLKSKGKSLKEKFLQVRALKMRTSPKSLCDGLPEEFTLYMVHVKSLKFEEEPDYTYLRNLFRDLAQRSRMEYNYVYDWSEFPNDALMSARYSVSMNTKPRDSIAVHSMNDHSVKAHTE